MSRGETIFGAVVTPVLTGCLGALFGQLFGESALYYALLAAVIGEAVYWVSVYNLSRRG